MNRPKKFRDAFDGGPFTEIWDKAMSFFETRQQDLESCPVEFSRIMVRTPVMADVYRRVKWSVSEEIHRAIDL